MEFAELIRTPKVDNVVLHRPLSKPTTVVLCITSHHLILSSREDTKDEFWILHVMIDSIEKKTNHICNTLTIRCKNLLTIQLDFKEIDDLNDIHDSIEWLSNFEDKRLFYPFFYQPNFEIIEDGWQTFTLDREYRKMLQLTDKWRISNANKDFQLCLTYPESVIVPKFVDDESLIKIAQFRCLGRFPVLSYVHKTNGSVIARSGQPMVGQNDRRCKEDERLTNVLTGDKRGYIIETRTSNISQLAKTKGGGFESEHRYPLLRRVHRPIDRYNTIADSLQKLVEACQDKNSTTEKWLSRLESSNWLRHIKDVLTCACLAAQCVDRENASVLIHGTEGMDATLQVTSISQIILDPDCRTVQGFEALIEREWLLAGHPFATRCKHAIIPPNSSSYAEKKEHSPMFVLFLDAVYQIHQQFPCSFEFNEDFMLLLLDNAYASQFGTFIGNNPKERKELLLDRKTTSLWSFINRPEELNKYLNPVYEPNNQAIWPSVAPQSLELWDGYFFRWLNDSSSKNEIKKSLEDIRKQQKELRSEAEKKHKRILDLQESNDN